MLNMNELCGRPDEAEQEKGRAPILPKLRVPTQSSQPRRTLETVAIEEKRDSDKPRELEVEELQKC